MKNTLLHLYRLIKYSLFVDREKEFVRVHKRRQAKIIRDYLMNYSVRKLHVGSQVKIRAWLNVDIHPKVEGVAYLDATKVFPLPDNSFDYVFTEHMIEHITFQEARFMLSECFRILRPGGKIRIATPDLLFLISLYQTDKSNLQKKYIDFSTDRHLQGMPVMDTVVINNFFRDWGHQFIHDFKSLKFLLKEAGFKEVTECSVCESGDVSLKNLELHGSQIGEEFNKLETIVVEANKA